MLERQILENIKKRYRWWSILPNFENTKRNTEWKKALSDTFALAELKSLYLHDIIRAAENKMEIQALLHNLCPLIRPLTNELLRYRALPELMSLFDSNEKIILKCIISGDIDYGYLPSSLIRLGSLRAQLANMSEENKIFLNLLITPRPKDQQLQLLHDLVQKGWHGFYREIRASGDTGGAALYNCWVSRDNWKIKSYHHNAWYLDDTSFQLFTQVT